MYGTFTQKEQQSPAHHAHCAPWQTGFIEKVKWQCMQQPPTLCMHKGDNIATMS